jgi:hypothetical protein
MIPIERLQDPPSLGAPMVRHEGAGQSELILRVLPIGRDGASESGGRVGDTSLRERVVRARVPGPPIVEPDLADVDSERSCEKKRADREDDEDGEEYELTIRGRALLRFRFRGGAPPRPRITSS